MNKVPNYLVFPCSSSLFQSGSSSPFWPFSPFIPRDSGKRVGRSTLHRWEVVELQGLEGPYFWGQCPLAQASWVVVLD